MDNNSRFPEECNAGAHIFKIKDGISQCHNCGITYDDYREFKEKEEMERGR